MAVNRGHRYGIVASMLAVVSVLLFFALYKYPESPPPQVDAVIVAQPMQTAGVTQAAPLPTVLPDEPAVIGADAPVPPVSIDVSDAKVLLVAVDAALQEVLDGLANQALVEIVDLRLEDAPLAEDAYSAKQSFRFSGAVDDVLRFVMKRYDHSYVISHPSPTAAQAFPLTRLFLYDSIPEEDTLIAGEAQHPPAGSATLPASDAPESKGNSGIARESGPATKRVNVANVLRDRASYRGNMPAYSYSTGTANRIIRPRRPSGRSSSASNIQASGAYDDEAMRTALAEMTRRASEEVKALAVGLKEAERNLAAQQGQ